MLILLLAASLALPSPCPRELPVTTAHVAGQALKLEIAATPDDRACGLAKRSALDHDAGMLFLYNTPRTVVFWMHETRLPLAIAFLDEQGQILTIRKMRPYDQRSRHPSPGRIRWAIETNVAWFDEHDVGIGDVVSLDLPADLVIID